MVCSTHWHPTDQIWISWGRRRDGCGCPWLRARGKPLMLIFIRQPLGPPPPVSPHLISSSPPRRIDTPTTHQQHAHHLTLSFHAHARALTHTFMLHNFSSSTPSHAYLTLSAMHASTQHLHQVHQVCFFFYFTHLLARIYPLSPFPNHEYKTYLSNDGIAMDRHLLGLGNGSFVFFVLGWENLAWALFSGFGLLCFCIEGGKWEYKM